MTRSVPSRTLRLPSNGTEHPQSVHATCIAHNGRGLLILGASGRGKSGLALQLLALGAQLVADDQVVLSFEDGRLTASAPDPLNGLIEAREVGILRLPVAEPTPVHLVVDLDVVETERLPPKRMIRVGDLEIALVHKSQMSHFPAALLLYLQADREE